ncbi:MAG: pentapeptide repeat-containing protein [Pseudomonadota bacterium]
MSRPAVSDENLARIKDLTATARGTWFSLLGVLVFVGVTLMGVTDADFYAVNRATELPLVGVSVPTDLFFFTAPVLTASIYIYFHLYLIRLADALAEAPPKVDDVPLSDAVQPWLINDAALYIRERGRGDGSRRPRLLDLWAAVVNVALVWGFGLVVLAFSAFQSLPARDGIMTGISAWALVLASAVAISSFYAMTSRMWYRRPRPTPSFRVLGFVICLGFPVAWVGGEYALIASGLTSYLAPIDLREVSLTEKPNGWQPYTIAREEFAETWCKRQRLHDDARAACVDTDIAMPQSFKIEWKARRRAALVALNSPAHEGQSFRGQGAPAPAYKRGVFNDDTCIRTTADLTAAFLPRAMLSRANFTCAAMDDINLEGAELPHALLNGASLHGANVQDAIMHAAKLNGARLYGIQMQNVDLRDAEMQNAFADLANLQDARLAGAKLNGSTLIAADFTGAQMFKAEFVAAELEWAVFHNASAPGADFRDADLGGSRFEGTKLTGSKFNDANAFLASFIWSEDQPSDLRATDFRAFELLGGAIRYADLRPAYFDEQTDWFNVFLDGSTTLNKTLRETHRDDDGNLPCQWTEEVLDDEAFYGRWRWWATKHFNADWSDIAPFGYLNVPLNPGPDNCEWK